MVILKASSLECMCAEHTDAVKSSWISDNSKIKKKKQ